MSSGIPPRTRAEQIAYNAQVMRQQERDKPNVRLSRTKRRVVIVATYSILAVLLIALSATPTSGSDRSPLTLLAVATIALVICLVFVDYAVGRLTKKNAILDERERAVRDHATAVAYRALTLMIGLATVYTIFASLSGHWLPLPRTEQEALPFGVALIWIVTTLPKAILAWTVPDPVSDATT